MAIQRIIFFFLFLCLTGGLQAQENQELYIPQNIQNAYEKGTRSTTGNPGKNYWQNHGNYEIHVAIHPPNRTVTGREKITYFNNSPDTLQGLNFKLILNNHKPQAPRGRQVSADYLTSGIHIDSYTENGVSKEWKYKNDGTNKYISLSQPLLPKDSIIITINWHYKVSQQSGREGAIDSTTFFLAYFYPRIAVYDDYYGWDFTPHILSQEFYNDFNNYTFEVTVPKDYIVWATGTLLNPKEVLQEKPAKLLKQSSVSDSILSIATSEAVLQHKITTQKDENTWKWKAENVTDIAIAISNHYNWDAGSVIVDKETGRRASCQAAYNDEAEDFKKMVKYIKNSLSWFSNNYPGVPYPFPKMTVVRGFADMEYPMMANDNSQLQGNFTRFVAEHEIAHSWFPFYMGINETRYAFMDEGWATAFEYLIGIHDLGKEKATDFFQRFRVKRWINDPEMKADLPIIIPTNVLSGKAMGYNGYGKAALGYLAVKDLLGDKIFTKALQGYMQRWHGKHPMPWDFFFSFNSIVHKNLNWFWNRWYFSNSYIDIALKEVEVNPNTIRLKVKNIGGMPTPFTIVVTSKDGTIQEIHQTPIVWKEENIAEFRLKEGGNIVKIELKGGIWMDADTSNNTWEKE